jgi:hypothetical protein
MPAAAASASIAGALVGGQEQAESVALPLHHAQVAPLTIPRQRICDIVDFSYISVEPGQGVYGNSW